MTKFAGRRFLVAGGTGDLGSAIVSVLLSRGVQVFVPARSAAKGERLRREVLGEQLVIVEGDIGTVQGAVNVADQLKAHGPLDGVVASLGGWWQGPPLLEVDPVDWDAIIAGNLTTHFAAARAFTPLLGEGGAYVQILGAAAEYPVPGSGLVSVTAAGVAMMGKVIAAEQAAPGVHFRQIMIASIVATRSRDVIDPAWVTAEEVGRIVADVMNDPARAEPIVRIEARTVT